VLGCHCLILSRGGRFFPLLFVPAMSRYGMVTSMRLVRDIGK
jgi:hypothetical protein